ncbi:hypothetical protein SISSUDRAFT_1064734 [Sistotremastrum suecicum HHB10207 ss-3]|uniref:Uncharacterized protein n=1 Tax=Sistotremastrum suecicum HHB10207 ss-3 TaxID=1314776 RepID=A0A166AAI4_9AGAM|nr:hypothetical protein SISSUDRAFT_1064734 [Sistotremastrum suecicum HHB10207 ss-3]
MLFLSSESSITTPHQEYVRGCPAPVIDVVRRSKSSGLLPKSSPLLAYNKETVQLPASQTPLRSRKVSMIPPSPTRPTVSLDTTTCPWGSFTPVAFSSEGRASGGTVSATQKLRTFASLCPPEPKTVKGKGRAKSVAYYNEHSFDFLSHKSYSHLPSLWSSNTRSSSPSPSVPSLSRSSSPSTSTSSPRDTGPSTPITMPSSPVPSFSSLPVPGHRRAKSHTMSTVPTLAPIDPQFEALEKASRLRARIVCSTCNKIGDDFPRCGRCGIGWCSRACRVGPPDAQGNKKRHVCS